MLVYVYVNHKNSANWKNNKSWVMFTAIFRHIYFKSRFYIKNLGLSDADTVNITFNIASDTVQPDECIFFNTIHMVACHKTEYYPGKLPHN